MTDETSFNLAGKSEAGQDMPFKVARIYMRVSTDAQDLARQEAIVSTARRAGFYGYPDLAVFEGSQPSRFQ